MLQKETPGVISGGRRSSPETIHFPDLMANFTEEVHRGQPKLLFPRKKSTPVIFPNLREKVAEINQRNAESTPIWVIHSERTSKIFAYI